jgi:hypothetical protein
MQNILTTGYNHLAAGSFWKATRMVEILVLLLVDGDFESYRCSPLYLLICLAEPRFGRETTDA